MTDLMPIMVLAAGFITPAIFYAGAAATSIPIIIHLLNKRRFRIVIWAAMDWLLAAQKRNARKMKLQRWLLLALRVIAIILLAMAVAQFTTASAAVAKLLGGGKVAVVVIDDSYSMGYRRGDKGTNFDHAKKLADDYLKTLDSGDKVAVIFTSQAGANTARLQVGTRSATDEVRSATVSDAGTDLRGALAAALKLLKEEPGQSPRVMLYTDLSRSSLREDATSSGAATDAKRQTIKDVVAELRGKATVRVIDVGVEDQSNVAVSNLRMIQPVAVSGMQLEFEATIFNGTKQDLPDVPVELWVDNQKASGPERIGRVEAGASVTHRLFATIGAAGRHTVEVRTPDDSLTADDVRRMVVDVQSQIPVLLIEGNPGDGISRWDSSHYFHRYTQVNGSLSGVVVPIEALALLDQPVSRQKIIVISDMSLPADSRQGPTGGEAASPEAPKTETDKKLAVIAGSLKRFVEDGGLLIIYPGDHVRAQAGQWNAWIGSGGAKLLPGDFKQHVDMRTEAGAAGASVDPMKYKHPMLEKFRLFDAGGHTVAIPSAQATQFMDIGVPADGSVDVVMQLRKPNGQVYPAVATKRLGRGSVVQFAATADTAWWTFPAYRSYIPFVDMLVNYEMAGSADRFTLRVGETLDLSPDVALPGWWTAPRATEISVTRGVLPKATAAPSTQPASTQPAAEATKEASTEERLFWAENGTLKRLMLAGYYGPKGGEAAVAVNPDGAEADILHISAKQMAESLGLDPKSVVSNAGAVDAAAVSENDLSTGGSIARSLLMAALLVFLLETILARTFSQYK